MVTPSHDKPIVDAESVPTLNDQRHHFFQGFGDDVVITLTK